MKSAYHNFDITLGQTFREKKVKMDGEFLTGVRSVTIHSDVDKLTTVTIEFINVTVNVEEALEPTEP